MFLSVAFLTACTLPAPVEDELGAFEKAFRPERRSAQVFEARAAALAAISDQDSGEVAELLIEAWKNVEGEVAPILKQRRALIEKGQGHTDSEARDHLNAARGIQERLVEAMLAREDAGAVEAFVACALEDRKAHMLLRLELAPLVERQGDAALEAVRKSLERSRKPEDLLIGATALTALGERAAIQASKAIALLGHETAIVREAAAEALVAMRTPRTITPLIDRLPVEGLRTRSRMLDALEVITAARPGRTHTAWKAWLEREGAPYLAGEKPLGGGTPSSEDPAPEAARYHGIPIEGDSVLFLIDRSNSMQHGLAGKNTSLEGKTSRIVRAKTELVRVLRSLPSNSRFNIIAFATSLRSFHEGRDGVIEVTPRNVGRAADWVEDLSLEFGTQIYDALDAAFTRAGKPADDAFYDSEVDTIFLLTDGLPFVGERADHRPSIQRALQRWNLRGRVVVHVVGLGREVPADFLRPLAEQNGGKWVLEVED
jgi:hypothetical protein